MKALVMVKRIYFDNDTHEILITEEDIKQLAEKDLNKHLSIPGVQKKVSLDSAIASIIEIPLQSVVNLIHASNVKSPVPNLKTELFPIST